MNNSRIIFFAGVLLVFITGCESNDYTVVESSKVSTKADTTSPGNKLIQQKNQNPLPETPPAATSGLKKTAMKKNPFLSWEEAQALLKPKGSDIQAKKVVILDSLKISAIFSSPISSQSYAIVDGRIVRENDEIANKNIKQIKAEEIILEDKSAEYIVRLNPLKNNEH